VDHDGASTNFQTRGYRVRLTAALITATGYPLTALVSPHHGELRDVETFPWAAGAVVVAAAVCCLWCGWR
jgi:hypothetical protein